MTQNQYDYIIIGAGQSDLTHLLQEMGMHRKNKAPVFHRGLWCKVYLLCSCAYVRKASAKVRW